jgi:flagellar motor switch protein FliM
MSKSKSATSPLSLGRPDSSSPRYRMLQGVHATFAQALGTALSTFLQTEIRAELAQVSVVPAGEFQKTLSAPSCLIKLRLTPRDESMVLHLSPPAVFGMLEMLLGGSGGSGGVESRPLTEIEWSLLEEVVRVVVRVLGESWQVFHQVEFKVESLESDPAMLPLTDASQPLVWVRLALEFAGETGEIAIAVPQEFFAAAATPLALPEAPPVAVPEADVQRNLSLLEDASVDLEVTLDGPTMAFRELMALRAGQVVRFNYPLRKPLQASVNGSVTITGHVVSAGRKRAFQIEQLPN